MVNCEEPDEGEIRAMEDACPVGRKWRILREQAAPRVMAINIDEGGPGAFKDRSYLERDPHRFLEGMLIAAQVTGTEACYIYLRDEYHDARRMLLSEIETLQAYPPCPRLISNCVAVLAPIQKGAGA